MIISKKSRNITRKDKDVLDIEFKAWYSILKKRMRYAVCGMRYAVCGMRYAGKGKYIPTIEAVIPKSEIEVRDTNPKFPNGNGVFLYSNHFIRVFV